VKVVQFIRQEMPQEADYKRLDSRAFNHSQHANAIKESMYDSTDGSSYRGADQKYFPNWRPNPQPRQAERWMKQAIFDLTSAKKEVRTADGKFSAPEWTCFKCHQVSNWTAVFIMEPAKGLAVQVLLYCLKC
jgi:hypothetical protein